MKSPTIPEVEPQFEKEIDPFQQQVIRCKTHMLSARHKSSIFEETLTPDPSVCRWLLDIISEDEHLIKESAHFVLSENYLVRVVAYTLDVPRKNNTIGLVQQVKDIENLINIINEELAVDLSEYYAKSKVDGLISAAAIGDVDLSNYYYKSEADALIDDKLNINDQIYVYTKQEDDALLLLKADKTELVDVYSKTETDEKLTLKLNITHKIVAYNKSEIDALLDDKLNISDQIDAYTKQEDDALLLLKADKIELADYVIQLHAASFAKTRKNDASILLAGGGDMLVSSLIQQPQLYEVRDIASGKSKRYVFATTEEMNK
ncbi:MAG: hypothetical protein EZS28_017639 [Streblomastix strix]|uniref:Uncharacterized protein n=1 Tax=Streblomastix strix TaxID=222440 RepID=A0A5J4VWX9_9EUKA|nr:MAG: hypothetical protein EZS28_017639 [Streblomastix strix]